MAWTIAGNNVDERLFRLIKYHPEDIRGICDESDIEEALKVWKSLRPYIALIGRGDLNPLHIKSFRSTKAFLANEYDPTSGELPVIRRNNTYNVIEKSQLSSVAPVFSLAAFEYLIKNGLDKVISDDVKKEWSIGKNKRFNNRYGFRNGMFTRLYKSKDFLNFQTSLLEEIL